MTEPARILFVGLGSPHGDDRVGWSVAEELQRLAADLPDVSVRTANVPLDLIDWLDGVGQLHVCDACCGDEPVGRRIRIEVARSDGRRAIDLSKLEFQRAGGSHDFGVGEVLDLAARLGRLPEKVVVHAVSGCRFDPGAGIIEELAACVPGIARAILEELTDARDVPGAVAAESG